MFNSVKSRIYLLAGAPLLVALFFMLSGIANRYDIMHEMDSLEPTSQLGIHIGSFIHETQKERGATAGLLGGNDQFQSVLAKQREQTNPKRAALRNYLASFDSSGYGTVFSDALRTAVAEMDRIDTIRSQVDARSIKAKEAISFYTHHNALMLTVVQQTVELATHSEISQLRTAYVTFMQGKERAGIERAVMSNVFAANEFGNGVYNKFSGLVMAQDTYIRVFRSFATQEQNAYFEQQMSDPAVAEVQRMRDIALSAIGNLEKASLLLNINESIGYGGLIHQFKNFVLRDMPKYEQQFKEKYDLTTKLLDEYKSFPLASEKEKAHLAAIRGVIDKYRDALVTVVKMHGYGASITELDKAVKISDAPAIEALHHLEEGTRLGGFNIDAKHWFETITKKINLLKTVENRLAEDLGKRGNELYSESRTALITLSLIATAMTLAVLITVFFIARGITTPLQHSVAFAQQIAAGDLTGEIKVECQDELGALQQAMKDMRDKLVDMFSGIGGAASQLAASAEEMANITAQTTQGIQQQQNETEQVATAMNEMSSTVAEVASSANNASKGAQEANSAALSGQHIVNDTIAAVDQVATKVEHNAGVVRKVNEDSEKIGVVLDVIRGIAEQTNLLALNAAIEAARAGEQGRGFAVVADEVRTLASRTQASTQEIQQVIEGLQSSTKDAVAAMDTGASEARASAEKATEARDALEAITATVSSINDMNMHIASAAEEQSSVAAEIDRSVSSISQVATETSSAAEQLSRSSNNLAQLSSGLTNMIAEFKV